MNGLSSLAQHTNISDRFIVIVLVGWLRFARNTMMADEHNEIKTGLKFVDLLPEARGGEDEAKRR